MTEPQGAPTADRARIWWRVLGSLAAVAVLTMCTLQVANFLGRSTETVHHRFPVDGVTRLQVDVGSGDATVSGSDRDDISIVAHIEHGLWRTRSDVRIVDGAITATARCPLLSTRCSVSYTISVPRNIDVVLESGNGNLSASELSGSVTLSSSNGDVTAHAVDATAPRRMQLRSGNGDVSATELRVDDVEARSSNGNVTLDLAGAPTRVEGVSSNGDVVVWLPDTGATYDLDMSTSNGDRAGQIRTDPESTRRVTIRSGNGDVRVGYRPS